MMKEIVYQEKKYYITEKQWKQLLARFGPNGEISYVNRIGGIDFYVDRIGEIEVSSVPCICPRGPRGPKCAFCVFTAEEICYGMYREAAGVNYYIIYLDHRCIEWKTCYHDMAISVKHNVYEALLGLKKVRRTPKPRRK